jgi:hypothetical protein
VAVNEGDTLETGASGALHARMGDGGLIALRPGTRLTITQFTWSGKEDGNERSVLALVRGGFRTITGVIGRRNKDNYQINTATATMGIRGTDHEPHFVAAGEAGNAEPGTYNKVNVGATNIRNAWGTVELGPNETGFAPLAAARAPVRLSSLPAFMRNAPLPLGAPRRDVLSDDDTGTSRRQLFFALLKSWAGDDEDRLRMARNLLRYLATVQGSGLDLNTPLSGAITRVTPLGVVSGMVTPALLSNGGLLVSNANDNVVLMGPNDRPLFMAVPGDNFRYSRDSAPLVDGGDALVGSSRVSWGIYAGGSVFLSSSVTLRPQYFHYMLTPNLSAPADLAVAGAATYAAVAGFTRPVTEAAQVGGTVTSFSMAVTFGALPRVTAYNLGVTDAVGRAWTGTLNSPFVLLTEFAPGGGGGDNLNVTCTGTCAATGVGRARGFVIGGPARDGVITSYGLRAGSAGVTGSIAAGTGAPPPPPSPPPPVAGGGGPST